MRSFRDCLIVLATTLASLPAWAGTLRCPADSVKVGPNCIDKYEASVWQIPAENRALVKRVQTGKATLADLTAGGATQVSAGFDCLPAFPGTFPASGNWTDPLYAVSVAGVQATACVTWYQAEQACALSGKRLVTNQEWQRAVAGTPDPGVDDLATLCSINPPLLPVATGSRPSCVSRWGAFDMIGNLAEWVGDWGDSGTSCTFWPSSSGDDFSCIGGDGSVNFPGATLRGGSSSNGTGAGAFAIDTFSSPTVSHPTIGFRCAR
jgi:formylglycine-generating enzyme required for sulfatase activity